MFLGNVLRHQMWKKLLHSQVVFQNTNPSYKFCLNYTLRSTRERNCTKWKGRRNSDEGGEELFHFNKYTSKANNKNSTQLDLDCIIFVRCRKYPTMSILLFCKTLFCINQLSWFFQISLLPFSSYLYKSFFSLLQVYTYQHCNQHTEMTYRYACHC